VAYRSGYVIISSTTVPGPGFCGRGPWSNEKIRVLSLFVTTMKVNFGGVFSRPALLYTPVMES